MSSSQLYLAAQLYYEENATQAEIAQKLGTSRPTVSRLLSEARRRGMVKIEVIPPPSGPEDLEPRLAAALGLQRAYVTSPAMAPNSNGMVGRALAPAVGRALQEAGLAPGEILLVSSGRTMYEVAQGDLPEQPGVLVAPTVGGQDQPEGWYQTNEITRMIADRIKGRAMYLFAPALPGPKLYETLQHDPAIQRVLSLWPQARCVLAGVGAPPMLRHQAPQFMPVYSGAVLRAVGDMCARFYDAAGNEVAYEGSERLIALELRALRDIPIVIAVAAGAEKVTSLIATARARYFNRLVTDPETAERILAKVATPLEG